MKKIKPKTEKQLIKEVQQLRQSPMTWQAISELPQFEGLKRATVWDIAHGKIPHKWRSKLGLYPRADVVIVTGFIPGGTITLGAIECGCGQWFVSNHPRRGRCFICSPYRGARR